MSVEASSGGASVGTSDRSGRNNVGDEWSIGIDQINEGSSDQRFSEQEKKIEESSGQRFSEEEEKQFDSFDEVFKAGQPDIAKPKIQKVPSMLRNNPKIRKYFQPKVFSFGPCHYPYHTLKMAIQIKVILAADFLKQNDVIKEDLYEEIKEQIKVLKACYDVNLTKDYKDHTLAWMFLVDGCAILQFIYISIDYRANQGTFRNLQINFDYEEFLAQDLFLLENQLPYQLLQLIIGRTSKQKELLESIYRFIFHQFRTLEEWYENKREILEDLEDNHVHLLDLLRKKLIQPLDLKDHQKRDLIKIITRRACFLFEIIINWTCFLFDKLKCNRNEFDRDRVPIPHRNIRKLREAGINLKPSKTSCVRDISFSGGTLKLPPIIVEESTATMFLNMLGYEMCPDFQNESEVSTYMYFMDELIDRTQDVEELREKNILQNQLGSDEEVLKLFNEISTHLFPNFDYHYVKNDIDNYFDNKGLMWLHRVSHDIHQYFKGRWSLLAFIAALLAVTSTIIQTVITVLLAYQDASKIGN